MREKGGYQTPSGQQKGGSESATVGAAHTFLAPRLFVTLFLPPFIMSKLTKWSGLGELGHLRLRERVLDAQADVVLVAVVEHDHARGGQEGPDAAEVGEHRLACVEAVDEHQVVPNYPPRPRCIEGGAERTTDTIWTPKRV